MRCIHRKFQCWLCFLKHQHHNIKERGRERARERLVEWRPMNVCFFFWSKSGMRPGFASFYFVLNIKKIAAPLEHCCLIAACIAYAAIIVAATAATTSTKKKRRSQHQSISMRTTECGAAAHRHEYIHYLYSTQVYVQRAIALACACLFIVVWCWSC